MCKMISFYLFDYYFILCVLCTTLGEQARTVLLLKIGTHYRHEKEIKFLIVCDFIASGTAYSVLGNASLDHRLQSPFCTGECLFSLSAVCFHVLKK